MKKKAIEELWHLSIDSGTIYCEQQILWGFKIASGDVTLELIQAERLLAIRSLRKYANDLEKQNCPMKMVVDILNSACRIERERRAKK